ncbi:MAG: hypothetical protein JXB34_11090 [Bacteroidales bacterium]|nr:hypothetical protein [Bacteroidales bacterium]
MGFLFPLVSYSQLYYRIEADFTTKEKSTSGYENLMMGKVYFDINQRQIVFDVYFPEKEVLIINDTATITVRAGKVKKHELSGNLIDFSVLSLFLKGELDYFGLKNTPFKLEKVEKENGLVISTWIMGDKFVNSPVSKLLLSQKNNNLHGLITFGPGDSIISKQIFTDYILVEGMQFPGRVLQFSPSADGSEFKKITTYKNIVVNSNKNDSFYKYIYRHN